MSSAKDGKSAGLHGLHIFLDQGWVMIGAGAIGAGDEDEHGSGGIGGHLSIESFFQERVCNGFVRTHGISAMSL